MSFYFFFNYSATTEIYTLSLHDALPIFAGDVFCVNANEDRLVSLHVAHDHRQVKTDEPVLDRKSTRLNSSHGYISYAVFCLKKKNIITTYDTGIETYLLDSFHLGLRCRT